MKGKIKKVSTAIALISIGVIVGIAMPIVVKGENGEATSAQVLKGKTFTSSLVGIAKEGAIEDFSKSIITKPVSATNDNFIETIELTPGYYDQIQVNTENVYNAGKAAGSGIEGNAADASKILKDYKAYVNGELITGTMANIGTATINTTAATGNVTTNITPGYYDKVTVNQTAAYNKGKTDGAAATKSHIFRITSSGDPRTYKLYVDGTLIISGSSGFYDAYYSGNITKSI